MAKQTRKIATYVGGQEVDVRVITVKDQNKLVGTPHGAKELRWSADNNRKIDVTDVHEDVLRYLDETDADFTVKDVEVEVESPAVEKSARS